ncbi:MAG: hypothetical protein MUC29_02345 [Pyrinomonadaceae bacterium]|jgi:hypothetical protein|nr:hypothetical protein [Pyrinomonadaceae bacterium]
METILLLVFKTFLFVSEIYFEFWKRTKEKTSDAEIIERFDYLEKEVKEIKKLLKS